VAAPPRVLTPVSAVEVQSGEGKRVCDFVEGFCTVTKDSMGGRAGEPIVLRDWQRTVLSMAFARRPDNRRRHRQALIGLPRKNGKSAIGSGVGLYGLLMSGQGAEVYSCAADKEQARIVFGVARAMVENNSELKDLITVYRDALEVPSTGSVYKVVSSEAFTKEGLNPSMVIYDELHAAPTDELYNVMSLAMGARRNPLLVAITTAGVKSDRDGGDSICYRLYQYGERIASGEVVDDSFFMAWWGADDDDDHKDPEVWARANPGYDDLIDPEDLAATCKKTRENEFRTKRLNQWVSSAVAWLPGGSWDACADRGKRDIQPRSHVVLGFDGSRSGDATGLVAVTVDKKPRVEVLGLWERPRDVTEWRVPRGEVKDAIRKACKTYDVWEIAWDEFLWLDAAEELEAEGLPVVVFPQTLSRMGPATQRFYELVTTKQVTHNGDPRLARHLSNAVLKVDSRGSRLSKDAKSSPRKIDLAVAVVMATDRAFWWLTQDAPGTFKGVPITDIKFVW
jgi:phage terminase large subunit-like protein